MVGVGAGAQHVGREDTWLEFVHARPRVDFIPAARLIDFGERARSLAEDDGLDLPAGTLDQASQIVGKRTGPVELSAAKLQAES